MSEMIERVARAIWVELMWRPEAPLWAHEQEWTAPWPDDRSWMRDLCRAQARTALAAMREPTNDMEDAADEPFHAAWKVERERSMRLHGKEGYASASFSLPLWRAMIDAALAPTDTPQR